MASERQGHSEGRPSHQRQEPSPADRESGNPRHPSFRRRKSDGKTVRGTRITNRRESAARAHGDGGESREEDRPEGRRGSPRVSRILRKIDSLRISRGRSVGRGNNERGDYCVVTIST